jgi:putative SOS response-associated peptidase YedK
MCGRTVNNATQENIEGEFLDSKFNYQFELIYNCAPTLNMPVISNDSPSLIQAFRFGFMPQWNPKIPVFNTVSEKVLETRMFSKPIKSQRCLVIATGFYEWMKLDDSKKPAKQPYLIYLKDQQIFTFAGIWDTHINKDTGEETKCFSIMTTAPNKMMDKIKHHRCPVILQKEHQATWLNNGAPMEEILKLASYQYPAENMIAYPVAKLTGNSEQCIEPIGEELTL